MHDEIIAHARAETPRECCGVIVGPPGELRELHQLTNVYQGVDFYEPDAAELYRVFMDTDARGWEIQVIYHSHPVSPAYPSRRDVEHAGWPDSLYVICSLEQPEASVLRAFRIVDGQITDIAVLS
ncbi:MAG: Mov34/MPN/PAD-1 family protein [Thermomicrobiales bacterium]